MAETILGIDLGTTNSEVAVIRDGRPYVIPDENGEPILPSVVGLAPDGRLLVGVAARNQAALHPDRTITSIKRKMGGEEKVRLGDQQYTPQEISAMILRALKARAERELGRAVSKAVITVPAYFNDSQKQATKIAGELAGLDVVRIINEPTAAALVYDPTEEHSERILVYDLGGGTFDVSVVQTEAGIREVLASNGDTRLGGDDFDELLLDHVCEQFRQEHGVDPRDDATARARTLRAVEAAKRRLSDHPYARIEEEFIAVKDGIDLHLNVEVSREEYEALIAPMLERTIDLMQEALQEKGLTGQDIDRVVLVGGSTRTPLIGELLEARLGQPAHREIHPDLCVAMGAAIQAGIIAGEDVGAVLVDVTPHSLGIRCMDEAAGMFESPFPYRFAPILLRNTPLPASRSEVFRTVSDEQPRVEIEVYQGESDDVRDNHRIGRFMVEGLALVPAGNPIVVQLDLTLDGLMRVSARERTTGLEKHIVIENALAEFEREDRDAAVARLDRLWGEAGFEDLGWDEGAEEADEDLPEELPELAPGPREGQRETVQARALIEKAEKLRLGVPEEDQQELDRLAARVNEALNGRDWPGLRQASDELADVLFYLEDV